MLGCGEAVPVWRTLPLGSVIVMPKATGLDSPAPLLTTLPEIMVCRSQKGPVKSALWSTNLYVCGYHRRHDQ
jgi:hypothetical protein